MSKKAKGSLPYDRTYRESVYYYAIDLRGSTRRESYIDGVWNKDSVDEWLTGDVRNGIERSQVVSAPSMHRTSLQGGLQSVALFQSPAATAGARTAPAAAMLSKTA